MEYKTEILPSGTRVLTSPRHRIGTDALLLVDFCAPKRGWAVADLCSGCGIVALGMLDGGLQGPCVAVELDIEGAALISQAVQLGGLQNLAVVQGDLCHYHPGHLFDLVAANPPYFDNGPLPPDTQRASARHEVGCSLPSLCAAASRLLKDGGRFCLCYPPRRLAALFSALGENRLEPKRLRMVRKSAAAEPWLALVDARKNGGKGLEILPDHILPPGKPLAY